MLNISLCVQLNGLTLILHCSAQQYVTNVDNLNLNFTPNLQLIGTK